MTTKSTPVLRFETAATPSVNVSVRIPSELGARIDAVREKAKAVGATFDVSGIVRAALFDACETAERELAKLSRKAAA